MFSCVSKLLHLALLSHLLATAACTGGKVTSERRSGKKLNVLLLSDSQMEHLASLLTIGEELSLRGHNVTMLLIPDKNSEPQRYGGEGWSSFVECQLQ